MELLKLFAGDELVPWRVLRVLRSIDPETISDEYRPWLRQVTDDLAYICAEHERGTRALLEDPEEDEPWTREQFIEFHDSVPSLEWALLAVRQLPDLVLTSFLGVQANDLEDQRREAFMDIYYEVSSDSYSSLGVRLLLECLEFVVFAASASTKKVAHH